MNSSPVWVIAFTADAGSIITREPQQAKVHLEVRVPVLDLARCNDWTIKPRVHMSVP